MHGVGAWVLGRQVPEVQVGGRGDCVPQGERNNKAGRSFQGAWGRGMRAASAHPGGAGWRQMGLYTAR